MGKMAAGRPMQTTGPEGGCGRSSGGPSLPWVAAHTLTSPRHPHMPPLHPVPADRPSAPSPSPLHGEWDLSSPPPSGLTPSSIPQAAASLLARLLPPQGPRKSFVHSFIQRARELVSRISMIQRQRVESQQGGRALRHEWAGRAALGKASAELSAG